MNKKAKFALWFFLAFSLIIIFSIMYFVFAGAFSSSVAPNNVNEDVYNIYNFTINNTATNQNLTQIKIIFPSSAELSFVTGSNGTSASNTLFSNTSSILTWDNTTAAGFVLNQTWQYFWFNASASTPGNYNFTVNITDTTAVINTTNVALTVNDTTAPAVTINLPLAQNYTSLSVNITLTENGYCEYSLNSGAANYTMQNNGNRDFNATNTSIADATYTLAAYCNDTAGNKNYTTTRSFQIDNTYPLISYGTGTAGNYANVSRNWIYVNVSVTETTETNITFLLYNSTGQYNSTTSVAGTRTINWTGLADGTYTYNVTIRDALNKANTTATYTITLDTTSPVISLISPANTATTSGTSVTFVFNVTDSSTTNCSLILNSAIINFNSAVNRTGGNNTFTNLSYVVSNTWSVNCTDNANNKVNSSSWSFSVLSFQFNGTARDENGNALNNSVINVTIRNQANWGVLAYTSTTSNASGWFNFSIASNSSWQYEPSIIHRNGSVVDFKSKTIPAFPSVMIQQLAGATFYLTPAGTINITAINSSSGRIPFQYQIKDTKLGYPVAEDHQNWNTEAVVYVPKNRNYSIMIYPNQSMPVSFNWNNFSSLASYNISSISSYDVTTHTLHKQFNTSMTMARVTGYANVSGINYTNFTVIPFLLEPGNMIHSEYGDMPYNLSSANQQQSDFFNLTDGWFNISLPATAESSTIVLFATAVGNDSNYYGGFRNISLSYGTTTNATNISMYPLMGTAGNITMDRIDGNLQIAIPTKKQTFNILNSTNSSLSNTFAHVETTVDYSSHGALEFTWMSDVQQSQSVASFSLPLINVTGVKEQNVFVSGGPQGSGEGQPAQYAPRRVSTQTASQIISNPNITVRTFSPEAIDTTIAAGSLSIALISSNSTCDIPNPADSCYLGGSSQNMGNFNPMQAVMGGGKISFRMGYSGILVHYINADMLASGPPDALFDSSITSTASGSSFAAVQRFGSRGPTIYDYALVSIPYSETAGSGLNDSASVSINIPLFYDDNWNVIWNTTTNGSSASALAGNHSHYSTYQSAWGNLTSSKTCTTSSINSTSQINETSPCYIDTSNNRIWIRIPHFSGTGPSVSGSVLAAGTTTPGSGSGTGGAAGQNKTRSYSWTKITPGSATIWKLADADLGLKQISITVNNPAQNVQITIIKYDGKPANVTVAKSGKVYKYLEIKEKNLGKNLSKAILTLQVNKSWVINNNLTKGQLALFKYNNSEWKEIKTDYKEEDTTNYYYDAELTSFSYFAIAEIIAAPVTCTPSWACGEWSECVEGTKTRTCTDSNNCGTATGKPAESETCEAEGKKPVTKTTWAIIIGVIIAVIVIILIYILYKKKKDWQSY